MAALYEQMRSGPGCRIAATSPEIARSFPEPIDERVLSATFSNDVSAAALDPVAVVVGEMLEVSPSADATMLGHSVRRLLPAAPEWVAAALADLLGVSPRRRELLEIFAAVRHVLEASPRCVIVFQDAHYATPAFSELLAYLEGSVTSASVLVITVSRELPARTRPDDDPVVIAQVGLDCFQRSDLLTAYELLGLAADLLPLGDAHREQVVFAQCETLALLGRPGDAVSLARRERHLCAGETPRARLTVWEQMGQTDDAVQERLRVAVDTLGDAGDDLGTAQGLEALAGVAWGVGDGHRACALLAEALGRCRRTDDLQTTTRIGVVFWSSLVSGPVPIGDAVIMCRETAWVGERSSLAEIRRLVALAELHAMGEDYAAAGEALARAEAIRAAVGQPVGLARIVEAAASIAAQRSDPVAAEHEWRGAVAAVGAISPDHTADSATGLVRALCDQGRFDEAERALPDEAPVATRARVLAGLRRTDEAAALVDSIDVDALCRDGDVRRKTALLLDLGLASITLGCPALARTLVTKAAEQHRRKGARVSERRALGVLDRLDHKDV